MAERVGVFENVIENVNDYAAHRRNGRDVNNLTASSFCLRSRPFAGFARPMSLDMTLDAGRSLAIFAEIFVRVPLRTFSWRSSDTGM